MMWPPAAAAARANLRGAPLEEIRSRFVLKLCDAALTAGLELPSTEGGAASGVSGGTQGYRTARRMLGYLLALSPGGAPAVTRRMLRPESLPFVAGVRAELLGFGSGATVFRLRPREDGTGGDWVLKVYRKSLGRTASSLVRHLTERRASYRRVVDWYSGIGVVPPAHFIVVAGPLLAQPAAACLQPYIGAVRCDPFHDLTPEALAARLSSAPRLRRQFVAFARATLRAAEREKACVDLVGRDNLVIQEDGSGPRLVLLDPGIYDFSRKAVRAPESLARLHSRLYELRRFTERLERSDSGGAARSVPLTVHPS